MLPRSVIVLLMFSLALPALAVDVPSKDKDAEQQESLELMKRQAAEYEVTLNTTSATKLTLHPEPLLRFTNPVGGVTDGIVVMWKEGERPALFAQIFHLKDGLWIHECQSMASAGLTMQAGKVTRFKPDNAAAKFTPLPDGPRAAEGAVQRLVQMKAQAARFSAIENWRNNPADPETSRYELRLLAKPVYRYQDASSRVDDAAIFAFVHGTDPEVFLVLEHRGKGTKAGWFYSLAPMTCWAIQVKLEKTEVWSVPERYGKSTPESSYHVWVHGKDK